MSKNFFKWAIFFEGNLSAAEWVWRIITILVVAGGGTTAGLLAKGSEFFNSFGLLGWIFIGLCVSLLITLIFYFIKLANKNSAEAAYIQRISVTKSNINPLSDSFIDQIIKISDLYLPLKQAHSHKQFKRCKIVGPGAVAILGGTYIKNGFIEIGSLIVIPNTATLTGVLVLENCTVENCEFIGVTLIVDKQAGEVFKELGAQVVGL
jgi:hypothetical protein